MEIKISTGETNWDELNKILGLESENHKLSEADYHVFIEKLIVDNAVHQRVYRCKGYEFDKY